MKNEKHESRTIDASELITDMDMEKILLGTYQKSRSAPELSEVYGIPIAVCFKKIKTLRKMGLLNVTETVRAASGKKMEYYTAGRVKVRFTVVLQMAQDFRRRFERTASRFETAENYETGGNQK
jgi:predicted transcriptional regulator